jgi:hypothetical protein
VDIAQWELTVVDRIHARAKYFINKE